MTNKLWEIARDVLEEHGAPLTVVDLWASIEKSGRFNSAGATPEGTLGTVLRRKTVGRTENWANRNKVFYEVTSTLPARFGLLSWMPAARVGAETSATPGVSIPVKDDTDIRVLLNNLEQNRRQLHNAMTNRLLEWARRREIDVWEGRASEGRYDALLTSNAPHDRDLLVEAKSCHEVADARLAVGQLFAYLRFVPRPEATDLALYLPPEPPGRVLDFVGFVEQQFTDRAVVVFSISEDGQDLTTYGGRIPDLLKRLC